MNDLNVTNYNKLLIRASKNVALVAILVRSFLNEILDIN